VPFLVYGAAEVKREAARSFGQQLGHFAAGIDRILKERNFEGKECGQ
jgi:hypothetical protein